MEAQDQSQDPGQEPAQSQETPSEDSNLQTPQPDQPTPPEVERQSDDSQVSQPQEVGGSTASVGPSGEPAEGVVTESSTADQDAAAVQREQELEDARRERLKRTGNGEGEIREGEVQAQRQEHNERTGGGDVPQASDQS